MAKSQSKTGAGGSSSDQKWQNIDFELFKALEALDRKDYGWFSRLTPEQQRKFSAYMLLHWMSAVKAPGVLGSFYLLSTDAAANKHMFNEVIQGHPELQWLMLCAASPGMGKQFHQWIPHLPPSVGGLRDPAKVKDITEYFKKVWPKAADDALAEAAAVYTRGQNFKVRLAKICPNLKISDVEALAAVMGEGELEEYERQSGG